jgi:Tat protein secretion system quality control protein TatD with DNase activity
LLDSHTHIDMRVFDADRERVLQRAREAGVAAVIDIGIDIASSEAAIALAEKHGDVFATVGIHPHDASKVTERPGWISTTTARRRNRRSRLSIVSWSLRRKWDCRW